MRRDVEGEKVIALVAKRDIEVGEELTFDYQWQRTGFTRHRCLCGSANCRGYLGASNEDKVGLPSGKFRMPHPDEDDPARSGGQQLVGRYVNVYWQDDRKFYPGKVTAYEKDGHVYMIEYTDGAIQEEPLHDKEQIPKYAGRHRGCCAWPHGAVLTPCAPAGGRFSRSTPAAWR